MKRKYIEPVITTSTIETENLLYTASPGIGDDYSKRHNDVVIVEEEDDEETQEVFQWDANKSVAHLRVWDR